MRAGPRTEQRGPASVLRGCRPSERGGPRPAGGAGRAARLRSPPECERSTEAQPSRGQAEGPGDTEGPESLAGGYGWRWAGPGAAGGVGGGDGGCAAVTCSAGLPRPQTRRLETRPRGLLGKESQGAGPRGPRACALRATWAGGRLPGARTAPGVRPCLSARAHGEDLCGRPNGAARRPSSSPGRGGGERAGPSVPVGAKTPLSRPRWGAVAHASGGVNPSPGGSLRARRGGTEGRAPPGGC